MARVEPAIFTNMCMITQGDRVLVQERVDPNWPGAVFPGGHVEPRESFTRSVIREVQEETGLTVSGLRLCGVKQWTHRRGDYRYVVLLYRADAFTGELRDSSEGRVFWATLEELHAMRLADGFDSMLEVFLRDDLTENYHWFDGEWKAENL